MKGRGIEAGREVMRECIDARGALTGEHGIGVEKQLYMYWAFTEQDMAATKRLRAAFCHMRASIPARSFLTRLSRTGSRNYTGPRPKPLR